MITITFDERKLLKLTLYILTCASILFVIHNSYYLYESIISFPSIYFLLQILIFIALFTMYIKLSIFMFNNSSKKLININSLIYLLLLIPYVQYIYTTTALSLKNNISIFQPHFIFYIVIYLICVSFSIYALYLLYNRKNKLALYIPFLYFYFYILTLNYANLVNLDELYSNLIYSHIFIIILAIATYIASKLLDKLINNKNKVLVYQSKP